MSLWSQKSEASVERTEDERVRNPDSFGPCGMGLGNGVDPGVSGSLSRCSLGRWK